MSDCPNFPPPGMDLRDAFAWWAMERAMPSPLGMPNSAKVCARKCYEFADIMMDARVEDCDR